MARTARLLRHLLAGTSLLALVACGDTLDAFDDFDIDLRGNGATDPGTSEAARGVAASRPATDNRGIISYPDYQVAVAEPGDTVTMVAARVGVPAAELARFNGLPADAPLRGGEIVVLPRRVAEPSAATGAIVSGPLTPGSVDVTTLAGDAIDRAETAPSSGEQPIRHRVAPGETAFTIARRYNVSVEALAEWNGLGNDYAVREDQFLLIPPVTFANTSAGARTGATATAATATVVPGQGTPTPTPPSASTALPATSPSPEPVATPPAADLEEERTAASDDATFSMPVSGSIVRDYDPDRFEWIAIEASSGEAVSAAGAGEVLLITEDANQNSIIILRHSNGLLTVYSGIDDLAVERGDSVRRGDRIASVQDDAVTLLFQVRDTNETYDPLDYLQ